MTREELIALVKPLDWKRDRYKKLRCTNGDCPITAAYRIKFGVALPNWSWKKAANELGIEFGLANSIVFHADSADETIPELEPQ